MAVRQGLCKHFVMKPDEDFNEDAVGCFLHSLLSAASNRSTIQPIFVGLY